MGKFLKKIMLLFVVAVFSVSLTAQNKLSVNLGYLNSNTTIKSSITGIQLSTKAPSNGQPRSPDHPTAPMRKNYLKVL